MGKKNFSTESMDSLMDTLTAPVSTSSTPSTKESLSSSQRSSRGRPTSQEKKEPLSTTMDADLVAKLRFISKKHDIPVTDLLHKAATVLVKSYEKKNGVIRLNKKEKGDIDSILGI